MENGKQGLAKIYDRTFIHACLILVLGFISYSNTVHVPFIFDDNEFIVENPILKDLKYFLEPSAAKDFALYNTFTSRYVGYLTFALNYRLHGLNVIGYHAVNLIIHLANALIVYWLVSLTFRTPFFASGVHAGQTPGNSACGRLIPLLTALLFVAHPIQTEAVTFIYQRLASLVTLFYLLSLTLYIKARLAQGAAEKPLSPTCASFYLLSLIFALLAVKTKENAFTLPVMIALYEFMFLDGIWKKRIACLFPFLLTMLIIPLNLIGIDGSAGDIIGDIGRTSRMQTEMHRLDYLFTQFRVMVTYLRLLVLPVNQNLDYDYHVHHSFFDYEVFFSFLLLFSIFSFAVNRYCRSRKSYQGASFLTYAIRLVSFGIFWFFIAISVESSVIPIKDVIFEHRLYLPSVGIFIAFSATVWMIIKKFESSFFIHATFVVAAAILLLLLSSATYVRNKVWKDETALWEDVVKKSPNKPGGYNELGLANLNARKTTESIYYFEKALKISPNSAYIYCNLGIAFEQLGDNNKAIDAFLKAIALNYGDDAAHYNIGRIYFKERMYRIAEKEFTISLRLNPLNEDAVNNLGLTRQKMIE